MEAEVVGGGSSASAGTQPDPQQRAVAAAKAAVLGPAVGAAAAATAGTAAPPPLPHPTSGTSLYQSEEEGSGSETDLAAWGADLQRRFTAERRQSFQQQQPPAAAAAATAAAAAAASSEEEKERDWLLNSPFIDTQHPVTLYEGIKLVLMAPVVLFKIFLLCIAVPYSWAVLTLLLLCHTPQTPMHPLRQFLVRQWVHQWARFLLFVAGFYHVPVKGWDNMRAAEECRAILVFNHPSYVDAAAIFTFFTPCGVSKAGVASIPFIGRFAMALQLFFVERRGSDDKANKHVLHGDAVTAIAQRAADRRFPLVAIAPEATTKAQPCLLKFRRGAFVAGQPVCPVLMNYRFRHFNPGWGVCYTPFHLYRLMAQFVNHLDITVLPPYHPSEEERQDWSLYATNVRKLMAEHLRVPLVEQGLTEERQLWRMGAQVNLLGTRVTGARKREVEREKAE